MTSDVKLLPCPFCGKSNHDRYPCEWLDGSGANVIRCAWCHGAAPMNVWNRRAALTQQPAAVDGAMVVRYKAAMRNSIGKRPDDAIRDALTAALAQPGGSDNDQ